MSENFYTNIILNQLNINLGRLVMIKIINDNLGKAILITKNNNTENNNIVEKN